MRPTQQPFRLVRRLLAVLVLLAASSLLIIGYNGPIVSLYPPRDGSGVTIQVVNRGYHGGLIRAASEARHLLPELGELPDSAYLEIGWGDADFYQAGGQSSRSPSRRCSPIPRRSFMSPVSTTGRAATFPALKSLMLNSAALASNR